jgi:hypothetical protein
MKNVSRISDSVTDLSRFVGGRARLWHFSCSHDRLAIELTSPAKEVSYIVLSFCETIDVRTSWAITNPQVALRDGSHPRVVFTDAAVRVECDGAELKSEFTPA